MSGAPPVQGIYAAIPTPFDEHRAIDTKALNHLVDYLSERGIHGLALLTEAAEDALLSPEERRAIIKTVSAQIKGKRSLMVFISAAASVEATDLARFAESKGAQTVVLGPPRVPGIGYRELYRHLDRVTRGVGVPVLLLSRPMNAIDVLSKEELGALCGHPGLRGVVVPHGPLTILEDWSKRLKSRNAAVLWGSALKLSKALKSGAHGAVCGLATIAASQAAELWDAIGQRDQPKVEQLEASFDPVVEHLGPAPAGQPNEGVKKLASRIARRTVDPTVLPPSYPFAALKEALRLQGHPVRTDVRPPYEPLRPEATDKLRAILQHTGVLS